jgi:hypothetical protein
MCVAHQHHAKSSRGADFGANLSICHHTRGEMALHAHHRGKDTEALATASYVKVKQQDHAVGELISAQAAGQQFEGRRRERAHIGKAVGAASF